MILTWNHFGTVANYGHSQPEHNGSCFGSHIKQVNGVPFVSFWFSIIVLLIGVIYAWIALWEWFWLRELVSSMLFEKCCSLLDECLYPVFMSISWVYDGIHLRPSIVSAYGFFYCLSCHNVEWKRISPQLPLISGTIFHYWRLQRELERYFIPYIAAYEWYFFRGSHSQRLPITICFVFL